MSLLEGFTLAGAIVAFWNALITVWDRWLWTLAFGHHEDPHADARLCRNA